MKPTNLGRRSLATLIVWAGLAGVTPAVAAPPVLPYTPPPETRYVMTGDQNDQITQGEIIVNYSNKGPIYYLDVYGAVDGTPDQAWKAITSYDRYQDFLPLVISSSVRRRTPGHVWQYVNMRAPWPLKDKWMVNANVENRPAGNITWTEFDGNIRYEHGYWQITPMGPNRCKVQYHLTVDPWLDIVPNWLVEFATKQVLPNVIKGIRKRVAAHH